MENPGINQGFRNGPGDFSSHPASYMFYADYRSTGPACGLIHS